MVSVSNLQLNFDASTLGSGGKTDAKALTKTALSIFCNLAAASAETSDTKARGAESVASNQETMQGLNAQTQACMNTIETLMQMVQEGQINLEQALSFITDTITQTIGANDQSATALAEEMEQYNQENEEILAEIMELNDGTLEGIDMSEFGDSTEVQQQDSQGNPVDNGGAKRTQGKANPNQEKIQELLKKYGANQQKIGMLSAAIANIGIQTQQTVAEGQNKQAESQNYFQTSATGLQTKATELFNNLSNNIKNYATKGITQQTTTQTTTTVYSGTDTTKAAEATAKAAAAAAGSVLSFGATSAEVAEYTQAAIKFTSAAAQNGVHAGVAEGFKGVIKQTAQTIGQQFAQDISNKVNEAINGALTNAVNNITGIDISSLPTFDFTKYLAEQEQPGTEQA